MTKEMVTATEPVGLAEANAILKSSKKGKLPVIDAEGKVRLALLPDGRRRDMRNYLVRSGTASETSCRSTTRHRAA